ncbi:MAG TPA: BPL-N domain-containing protein [Alphaproteobacteria bacterium]|nr:BPL-N domain-containing protein [Alphaproteobacteria bacterium]
MKILIFRGEVSEGASTFSANNLYRALNEALQNFGVDISFISAKEIKEGSRLSPDQVTMFVMGGGRFTQVRQALGEEGLRNIEDYTRNGGIYTGVCMGSYAAFPDIEFSGQIQAKGRGLRFFNATARGSLPVAMPYDGTANSAAFIEVQHLQRDLKFPALYWGGNGMCEQELLQIGATPLSKITLGTGEEKVVSAKINVGDKGGKAFITAYHPEAYRPKVIGDWLQGLAGNSDCYMRLNHEMRQHPANAYMMAMACLLDDIGLIPHHSFIKQINQDFQQVLFEGLSQQALRL